MCGTMAETANSIIDVLEPLKPQTPEIPSQDPEADRLKAKQENTAKLAADVIARTYAGMCQGVNELLGLIHSNPYKLTIRQAAAAIGVRGALLLMALAKVKELATLLANATGRKVDEDIKPAPDGISFDANEDGTIKVIEAT